MSTPRRLEFVPMCVVLLVDNSYIVRTGFFNEAGKGSMLSSNILTRDYILQLIADVHREAAGSLLLSRSVRKNGSSMSSSDATRSCQLMPGGFLYYLLSFFQYT